MVCVYTEKNTMNKKSLWTFAALLFALSVVVFVFVVSDANAKAQCEVNFSCPSGQESDLIKELLSTAFPTKVLMVYRKQCLASSASDGNVRRAIVRPKISQQNYQDGRWSANVVFAAHAKTQGEAESVLNAALRTIEDFVHDRNVRFEEESLAQQRGRVSKLKNKITTRGSDPALVAALSNEVRQIEVSRKIVVDNLMTMNVIRALCP